MNNEYRIVLALRQNDPDAAVRLFDAYADRIFRYCWFMLRNRDFALIALRDTLVVAQAHIGQLADTEALGSWLYALARAECRRRRPVPPVEADEPPSRPQQPDADSRLLAWNAVTSMDADEMEALELSCRHNADLGLVLNLTEIDVRDLLDRARLSLEDALGAEMLVSRGGHACPDRAQVMRGWTGTVTPELRDRVLHHAAVCHVCGPHVPRNVSAARVFALLPDVSLPVHARDRVLAFFTDPRMAAYRDFAVARASSPTPAAGSEQSERRSGYRPEGAVVPAVAPAPTRAARIWRGRKQAATAALAVAVGVTVALTSAGGGLPLTGHRPSLGPAGSMPTRQGAGAVGAIPVSSPGTSSGTALPRVGASGIPGQILVDKVTKRTPPGPVAGVTVPPRPPGPPAPPASGEPTGTVAVSPDTIDLGGAASGTFTVTAAGAAETWNASSSSSQLSLSTASGSLLPGQSQTVTVTVNRAGGASGSGLIYVSAANSLTQPVQVSWAVVPPKPGPSPTATPPPSPRPTPTPTPRPSPSPSPSGSASPTLTFSSPPPSPPGPKPTTSSPPPTSSSPAPSPSTPPPGPSSSPPATPPGTPPPPSPKAHR